MAVTDCQRHRLNAARPETSQNADSAAPDRNSQPPLALSAACFCLFLLTATYNSERPLNAHWTTRSAVPAMHSQECDDHEADYLENLYVTSNQIGSYNFIAAFLCTVRRLATAQARRRDRLHPAVLGAGGGLAFSTAAPPCAARFRREVDAARRAFRIANDFCAARRRHALRRR